MGQRTETVAEQLVDPRDSSIADASRMTHSECAYAVVDTSTDSTTVSAVPTIVFGVYVNTVLSAHTVIIQDDSTAVITLPASLAAGTNLHWPNGIRCNTSLVVNPDNSSTGNITVLYKAI